MMTILAYRWPSAGTPSSSGRTGKTATAAHRGAAYLFARNQGGGNNWGQVTKLTASDAENDDYFGASVAISGDTLVVGADLEDGDGNVRGAAYLFERNQGGADSWGQVRKLAASDAENGDHFGNSVAISGDTVVVGALAEDGVGSATAGRPTSLSPRRPMAAGRHPPRLRRRGQ